MEIKEKPLISVLICSYNDADLVGASLYSLDKLTKNPFVVHLLDNNSGPVHAAKLQSYAKKYPWLKLEKRIVEPRPSWVHGNSLNYLTAQLDTPYGCIMDADFAWVRKNWDQLLLDQLQGPVKAVGTQTDNPIRSPNFPMIFGVLFETACLKELRIDFQPKDVSRGLDVAWEMGEKFLARGWQGKMLPMHNTREFKQGPFASIVGAAEYYSLDNPTKIFGCHFGRGAFGDSYKYLKGQTGWRTFFFRLPFLGSRLVRALTQRQRRRWIAIVKKLTDQESYA